MKVSIIGFGLIGGSIALNLKLINPATEIVAVDPDDSNLEYAVTHGFCDVPRGTIGKDIEKSDFIVLATHLDVLNDVAEDVAVLLSGEELVMDVASVKGWVVEHIKPIFDSRGISFVASHPIAGTEKSGAMNAVKGLFDGARCIIAPYGNSQEEISKARLFWELLGSQVELMDPFEHDRIFSQVSHLPHLIAYALVDYVLRKDEGAALSYAGGGFRDFTRIAASSPDMWVEIFKRNRENVVKDLDSIIEVLKEYRYLLKVENWDELYQLLDVVSKTRRSLKFSV
ncbi:prephenate dehydrogenase [Thermosulfidibacter takaii ABI70S6]|uniref:Prephenate dehydrogenase n=1 Tax=Thermosulfidibacter takaii (strain DSM 17441 / JCM 13301 / NBRC 103674 / ABI70S6) TaxID=1298851 RepID=A0A0S3QR65_THET7|nr:prephenate dehydrogenase/arogenate dehydrogenase family protein [Thermosulfidibacter takaii]BAT70818.1 prephenate dehydrogenase [Thermosulfidibacter takaii ABI70S6]